MLLFLSGCGAGWGALAVNLGAVKPGMVPAEFKLTQTGPVLVLVDDDDELMDVPEARSMLARQLTTELVSNKAISRPVRPEVVEELRKSHRDLDQRGCREVGCLAEAEQVIWLRVRDFYAGEQSSDRGESARITVSIKVINAMENHEKSKVRLWPTTYEGHSLTVELSVGEAGRAGTRDNITRVLCDKTAATIAKLFYEHPMDEFALK